MDFGKDWTVKDLSIPQGSLKENGRSEKEEQGVLSEADDCDFAWWRNNGEIEVAVDILRDEHDDWIGLDLKLLERATLWEEEINLLFDWESLGSQLRKVSTEEMDINWQISFGR